MHYFQDGRAGVGGGVIVQSSTYCPCSRILAVSQGGKTGGGGGGPHMKGVDCHIVRTFAVPCEGFISPCDLTRQTFPGLSSWTPCYLSSMHTR